jgi:ComF family protein
MICNHPADNPVAVCHDCSQKLPENPSSCSCCAAPLPSPGRLCPQCQTNPPAFASSFIPFRYEKPLDQLIWKFKFRNNLVSGKLLADLFLQQLEQNAIELPEVIIPVPLHNSRLRQRGYNQASWLATQVGKRTGIPVDKQTLVKTTKTPAQHELGLRQRMHNLENAFQLTQTLRYRHVAIMDDVVTTGTTAGEISKLLLQNSQMTIQVWALARALGK